VEQHPHHLHRLHHARHHESILGSSGVDSGRSYCTIDLVLANDLLARGTQKHHAFPLVSGRRSAAVVGLRRGLPRVKRRTREVKLEDREFYCVLYIVRIVYEIEKRMMLNSLMLHEILKPIPVWSLALACSMNRNLNGHYW
jgi:hypothetical protein